MVVYDADVELGQPAWPAWVRLCTSVSHFALATSSASTFYIYYALHGVRWETNQTA